MIGPALRKWLTIANILGIDESVADNFCIAYSDFGGFPAFEADAPDAARSLERLDEQALCLRIINLNAQQQAWLKARVQRDIEAGFANNSLLNQVRAIIDLSSGLEGLLVQFAREQQAQATLRRENAEAKELLLELLTDQLDEERLENAKELINATLLSLANDQERSNWLTARTTEICEEANYRIHQSLGLALNQEEYLAAVNDKITARLPEEQQQAARDCLTAAVAAKPAAEQLAYLSSIYREDAAFAEFLTLITSRASQMQDFERQVANILRFVHQIRDPQTIAHFKAAVQQAFPLDIAQQRTLFNEYETTAKADFSLAGFQQFLDAKKPKPVAAPIAPAINRRNTTSSSSSSSSSGSNSTAVTPAFDAQKKQAAEKTAKRKKEATAPADETNTSTRQLRPRKNGNTTKQ